MRVTAASILLSRSGPRINPRSSSTFRRPQSRLEVTLPRKFAHLQCSILGPPRQNNSRSRRKFCRESTIWPAKTTTFASVVVRRIFLSPRAGGTRSYFRYRHCAAPGSTGWSRARTIRSSDASASTATSTWSTRLITPPEAWFRRKDY